MKQLFPFVRVTISNDKECSIWPLNIAIKNNYHTCNSFIKVYYFSSPVMMSSFHLSPPKLPGNFAMFSSLSVGESPSTNSTIFVIGRTNSHCSAPTASPSFSLIVRTTPCFIGKCLYYAGNWPIISIIVSLQKDIVSLLRVSSFTSARFSFL